MRSYSIKESDASIFKSKVFREISSIQKEIVRVFSSAPFTSRFRLNHNFSFHTFVEIGPIQLITELDFSIPSEQL